MDKEAIEIQKKLDLISKLVEHEGWAIAENAFIEKINNESSFSSIKLTDYNPEELKIEMLSREKALRLINSWLEDVRGAADFAKQNSTEVKQSYIITKED